MSEDASGSGAIIGIVPFNKFLPLIVEIGNLFNDVVEITQAAEHNKRTCEVLLQRVYAADLAVIDLKVKRNKQEFFNNKNYLCLQNLVNIITQIKKFILDISQMKTLIKYIQAKSIQKTFNDLCKEFDSCVNVLALQITIKTSEDIGHLKSDQDELNKYLEEMKAGINSLGDDNKEIKECLSNFSKEFTDFSTKILKVNAMNSTMEKLNEGSEKNQSKIDNIFHVHPLNISDYEKDEDEQARKNGRVTKWVNIKNKGEEFAFKSISEKEDQRIVQNQVTILKELHDQQNIIRFYGFTYDGNKWYLVTEWAEYGNLREFYINRKDRFDLKLKLRIALDIARGLNFFFYF
ncbi:hypothetical protein C1645_16305 [Glomus cerebriforme]|uniref:Protein kinase domain-containing protein n=1 Tax=Glomus cerebriforme TaxID=658196 RepID=A0A397T593_9GLOM|nr:hypothetical protein C1645_16305 [Glomus cerebriforme]